MLSTDGLYIAIITIVLLKVNKPFCIPACQDVYDKIFPKYTMVFFVQILTAICCSVVLVKSENAFLLRQKQSLVSENSSSRGKLKYYGIICSIF